MSKTPKLFRLGYVARELSPAEVVEASRAFHRHKKTVSHIVGFLEHHIVRLDSKLSNTEQLYDKARADLYSAALLAERAAYLRLLEALTTFDNDDQSGE